MWFSGDCNWMCTHQSTAVPLVSHNPINGGTENKYGRNGRKRGKIGREWIICKERGGFGDGWDYCFSEKIVSQ